MDVLTELVKLHEPKTLLDIGPLRAESIESLVTYKSLNRLVFRDYTDVSREEVEVLLDRQGFLGEVEWDEERKNQRKIDVVQGYFDETHEQGALWKAILGGWRQCASVFIVGDIECPNVQLVVGMLTQQLVRSTSVSCIDGKVIIVR